MRLGTRLGTTEDLSAIYAIEAASFAESHGGSGSGWTIEALSAELERPHTRLFVVQQQDVVVGYCLLWLVVDEAEVLTLAVDPVRRRQGIATHLLEGVMAGVATEGARSIYLDVRESNGAGRALYARAGFVQIGERKRYYDGQETALMLKRCLGALSRVATG